MIYNISASTYARELIERALERSCLA